MSHQQTTVKRQTLRSEPRIGRWLDAVIVLNFVAFGISTILTDLNRIAILPSVIALTTIGALIRFNDQQNRRRS